MSDNNENRPKTTPAVVSGIVLAFAVLSTLPFFAIGIFLIVSGIDDMSYSGVFGTPKLVFGIIWTLILVVMVIFMTRMSKRTADAATVVSERVNDLSKNKPASENKSTSDGTGYQTPEYIDPRNDPRFDYEWMKHDDCEADHKDDEDSVMKGYE